MIDATYRTTKYDIPLFFLVVPTNVGYVVAAEFCVQSEGADDITEALKVRHPFFDRYISHTQLVTSSCEDMKRMVRWCIRLTHLTLTSFDYCLRGD